MKRISVYVICFFSFLFFSSCSTSEIKENPEPKNYKYLALGDSYTIGQSVCATCKFPMQLQDSIKKYINSTDTFYTQVIAQTGWTTTNLKDAITNANPLNNFDLVTLLIGVNNQYQNKPFSLYEIEFPELISKAIQLAKGRKQNVIVVSIPDYAYSPFGAGSTTISTEIDQYNLFAQNYCMVNGITFINITDITRLGLEQTNLVASDGLHPSTEAYSRFVERLLPEVKVKLSL